MRGDSISITHLIRGALEDGEWMTMGEVMMRAHIVKTLANDVSSVLAKLRDRGVVATQKGPSTSGHGPRLVRKYRWVGVAVVKVETVVTQRPGLGVFRI